MFNLVSSLRWTRFIIPFRWTRFAIPGRWTRAGLYQLLLTLYDY
jgi:hypothetical protein